MIKCDSNTFPVNAQYKPRKQKSIQQKPTPLQAHEIGLEQQYRIRSPPPTDKSTFQPTHWTHER